MALVADQWDDRELGELMADEVSHGLGSQLMEWATARAREASLRRVFPDLPSGNGEIDRSDALDTRGVSSHVEEEQ
jgi:hypothetical protein